MRQKLLTSLLLFSTLAAEELAPAPAVEQQKEFEINLQNPTFSQGVITTDQGGVVTAPGMRIQAQKIAYTNRIENGVAVQKIVAEGDLLMEYADRAFVGKKLEYDFITKTGTLWEGKTYVDLWFLGGEKIQLTEDSSYYIYNAYITTCEGQDNAWDIHANTVQISKEYLLSAKNIQFRFIKMPIFWLPHFKSNLKFVKDPPIRYKIVWDKGLGPRATLRYKVFSWEKFNLFFRLDYRIKRGPGAAIETDYRSDDRKSVFRTKSYGAYDKSWPDEKTNRRYRLQGLWRTQTKNEKTFVHMTYDKMRDEKMPGDFRNEDFEVNTQKRSRLLISHHEKAFLSSFSLQPRINNFQSINQELPYIMTNVRPFQVGHTGIISDNVFTGGYLDYIYDRDLRHILHPFHAVRLETRNTLYRPVRLSYFTVTPTAGFVGIYYNNGPKRATASQTLFTYGGEANTHLYGKFGHYKHMIEPYVRYQGITRPTTDLDRHYIFGIDDGYFRMNLLRAGVRNVLFSSKESLFAPPFTGEIFTYGFFGDSTFKLTFPKAYAQFNWSRSFFMIDGGVCWNFEEQVLDYSNVRTGWTVSEDFAFNLEFRHRSKYDWRKADHESFILDVAKPIHELVHSPLSDGRNTLLARAYLRILPGLTCLAQAQHGWGRRSEPRYNEFKLEFFKTIACSWQLKVGYQYAINDPFQFTANLSIIK